MEATNTLVQTTVVEASPCLPLVPELWKTRFFFSKSGGQTGVIHSFGHTRYVFDILTIMYKRNISNPVASRAFFRVETCGCRRCDLQLESDRYVLLDLGHN